MTEYQELEQFKRLNLCEVAKSYGYELDKKESSRSSLVMRQKDDDKIIIKTGDDGHDVFFSVHTNASGSVLDFVMYKDGVNLGYARKILRAYTGQQLNNFSTNLPPKTPVQRNRTDLIEQWRKMRNYEGGYLESRGLASSTISKFSDRLRIDHHGNVAFRHDDLQGLSGWELKNNGFTGFAKGGKKGLFAARVGISKNENPPRIILAESAIDAMSYYQTEPSESFVLSFAGGLSNTQLELLTHVLTKYPVAKIISATDADEEGDKYASKIAQIRSDSIRARPTKGKDWNDAIRKIKPI